MAGGMGWRPDRPTLAERARQSGVAAAQSQASATAQPQAGRVRHCWVNDPPGHPGRWPGLVVEWRRAGVWEARALYVVERDGEPVVVEAWVGSAHLEPVVRRRS
jgi:hypothetical protein